MSERPEIKDKVKKLIVEYKYKPRKSLYTKIRKFFEVSESTAKRWVRNLLKTV